MRFHRIDYARIEREALSRNVSLYELSKRCGLHASTIPNAVANERRIRSETIHRIAELFGIEATDLLIPIDPDSGKPVSIKEDTANDDHSNDRAGEFASSG